MNIATFDPAALIAAILCIVAAMVAITNIIVEVLKKLWGPTCPSTLLAFVVALALAIVALIVYCSYTATMLLWYYIVGAVLLGFFTAYAAMFGFDKLKQVLEEIGQRQTKDNTAVKGRHEADE